MSESVTEKHLIDPDKWFLAEKSEKDILWMKEHGLKELWEDLIWNPWKALGKELKKGGFMR